MGWQWSDGDSWSSWGSARWRSQSARRGSGPNASWGQWKCQCGNIQSGSQCKGCRSKYWEVSWESVPGTGVGSKPQATRAPWAKPDTSQPKATSGQAADLLSQLEQFLSQDAVDQELAGPAAALRAQLRVRAPASSKRQKLKSVMDRIDHHKTQIHKAKKRLKDLEFERATLEEQLQEHDKTLQSLESDKEALCTLVGAPGAEDSASDAGSSSQHTGHNTPTASQAEAYLGRLDPHQVLRWAQQRLQVPEPRTPHDPHAYYIGGGGGEDADTEMASRTGD